MPKPVVNIPLPKSWPAKVCAAMLHVVSLAKYAAVYTRSWAADSRNARVRLRADKDRLLHEIAPDWSVENLWEMATINNCNFGRDRFADFTTFPVTSDDPLIEILEDPNRLPREVWIDGTKAR